MRGKKEFLSKLLAPNGDLRWAAKLISKLVADRQLRILAYHRVCDYDDNYPFDLELISATPEQFDWQVGWLKEHFDLVTFKDLAAVQQGLQEMPRRPLIITFDDGFDDNYKNAFPILKRHGAAATFFVSTDYINGEKVFWYDWLAHLILRESSGRFQLDALSLDLELPDATAARRDLVARCLAQLKATPWETQRAALTELEQRQQVETDRDPWHLSATMSWSQVHEMAQSGMEIGSHGAAHLMLAKLSDDHLDSELETSKQQITQHTGQPVVSIAYPVGSEDACDDRVFQRAAALGYQYGCVYQSGRNQLSSKSNLALHRGSVERYTSRAMFACTAGFAPFF